ncbi:MAG: FAD-dependent oxidoreductase, partial [Prevotella sp.]|nr:FAD-dependent oxidoreductase [Prevotella sp.]
TGFHYVGGLDEGQSLYAAFKYLGLLSLPWHRLDSDGFDRITIGGRSFAFAEGYDTFADKLAEEFPKERTALRSYADLLRRSAAAQFAMISPRAEELSDFVSEQMSASAWQYLNETFHDPLLIDVLSGTSLKTELRKESLPLFTFLHANSSYIESSWRLRGDSGQIVNTLATGILSQGGEIICNARVEELRERGGKITHAVCADGEQYAGDIFISDIHPAHTVALLKQSALVKRVYRNRINSLENTFGMFTASLRIKPKTLRYFNYNRYIYRSEDVWEPCKDEGGVSAVLVSCRVPEDDSGYTEIVDVLTPMTYDRSKELSKSSVAAEMLELAGGIEYTNIYTSTPLTWSRYTLTPEGSAYGVRKDWRNPLMTMLSTRTPVPNLLQTGQSLMLHGVHGVTMTAFYTCAEVLGRDVVWRIVNE